MHGSLISYLQVKDVSFSEIQMWATFDSATVSTSPRLIGGDATVNEVATLLSAEDNSFYQQVLCQ